MIRNNLADNVMNYVTSCLTNVTPSLLLSQKQLTLWPDLMGKKTVQVFAFYFYYCYLGNSSKSNC